MSEAKSEKPEESPPHPTQELMVGTTFMDRYEIESVVGFGGMGKVFKAQHKFMKRTAAIKVMHAHLVNNESTLARFQKEAETVSRLNHPNIVAIHDFGLVPRAFLVMDYLDGISLAELLDGDVHLEPKRCLPIFGQICAGLVQAHQCNVIHRDLKPSNIMLITSDGQPDFVKIVDFGIAKLMLRAASDVKELTCTGEVFGSPLYMSPEQCRARPMDGRSDIYSLGCIMYRTLTGHQPLPGSDLIEILYNHVNTQAQAFSDICPELGIPDGLEAIVLKCLEKQEENRFQSMQELKDALEAFSRNSTSDSLSSSPLPVEPHRAGKKPDPEGKSETSAAQLVLTENSTKDMEISRAALAAESSRAASVAEAGFAANAAEESLAASYAETGRAASALEDSLAASAAETSRVAGAAESARALAAVEASRAAAAAESARAASAAEAGRVASANESQRAASVAEAGLAASAAEAGLAAAAAEARRASTAAETGDTDSQIELSFSTSATELERAAAAAEAKRAASAAETARSVSASEAGLAASATEAAFAASAQEAVLAATAHEAALAASALESHNVASAAEACRAASAAESVRAASAAEFGRAATAAESGRAAGAAETSRAASAAEADRARSAGKAAGVEVENPNQEFDAPVQGNI